MAKSRYLSPLVDLKMKNDKNLWPLHYSDKNSTIPIFIIYSILMKTCWNWKKIHIQSICLQIPFRNLIHVFFFTTTSCWRYFCRWTTQESSQPGRYLIRDKWKQKASFSILLPFPNYVIIFSKSFLASFDDWLDGKTEHCKEIQLSQVTVPSDSREPEITVTASSV